MGNVDAVVGIIMGTQKLVIIGIVISFIVFLLLFLFSKKKSSKRKVFGVFTIITFISVILFSIKTIDNNISDYVYYEGKKIKVYNSTKKNMVKAIDTCDKIKIDELLNKYPELTITGIYNNKPKKSTPLGYAIYTDKYECADYLLEKGLDINRLSPTKQYGSIEFALSSKTNELDKIKYLLTKTDLDVNKREGLDIIKVYLGYITGDNEISDEEVTIFKQLLSKGMKIGDYYSMGKKITIKEYIDEKYSKVTNINKVKNLF